VLGTDGKTYQLGQTWRTHPFLDTIPLVSEDQLQGIADSIAQSGLLVPITLWQDDDGELILIDGRTRLAACKLAGVKPKYEIFPGDYPSYRSDDPIDFIVSSNLGGRRSLTKDQLAVVALKVMKAYAEQGVK